MTRPRRSSAPTTAVVLALADRGLLKTTWDIDTPAGRPTSPRRQLDGRT